MIRALVLCMLMLSANVANGAPAAIDYRSAPKAALVVGIDDYGPAMKLRNGRRDAELIASRLRAAGFSTRLVLNADRASLYREVGALAATLKGGGVGAFYYAGHGLQLKGINYLIPRDAPIGQAGLLAASSMPVDHVVERLRLSGAHLSIVLLDACRNEPGQITPIYRGDANAGFVPLQPAHGMVVAYATQPGERALDGKGSNSPFASALANWLTRPGLPIESAMKQVMTQVRASTRDEQLPWMASSMVGNFALVPAPGTRPQLFTPAPRGAQAGTGDSARGVDQPLGLWFHNQQQTEQMQLTVDIGRMARGMTPDDMPLRMRQARRGNVLAQAALGTVYREGNDAIRRSNSDAIKWLGMAARQQLPYALNELGEMMFMGQGSGPDKAQARRYFVQAAAQGYTPAKLNLLQLDLEEGKVSPAVLFDSLMPPKS